MTEPQSIAAFEGRWRIARRIEDQRAGQVLEATGYAALQQGENALTYDEELTLNVPGQAPMTATRRYLWQAQADQIRICFEDGRYFHSLELGVQRSQDHHDCPPDSYDAAYDFTDWPQAWRVIWTVSGPRKSYVMTSVYSATAK